MTDERKARDRHEAQAEAFLVGWIAALLLGLYLGASDIGNGLIALALIGGIGLAALWHHFY
jgi:hypothetical protein